MYNKKDEYNLQVGNYDILTCYNVASINYLAVQLMESPKEAPLLTVEYKIQLLLPCLYDIFSNPVDKFELKFDLVSAVAQLFKSLANIQHYRPIDNLNQFGVPLDKVLERIFDHIGGVLDEKDRSTGIELFNNVQKLLTEKALASLLISIISASRNHALFVYLITEYKNRITEVMKTMNKIEDIQEVKSHFLNAGHFKKLLEAGIDSSSPKFKENNDLISCCVNILKLIYLKLKVFFKSNENYKTLQFKDANSLFSPIHLKLILAYGEKVQGLSMKVKDEIKVCTSHIEKMTKENPENLNVQNFQIRQNELYMILDSIDRIGEIYAEIKPVLKA